MGPSAGVGPREWPGTCGPRPRRCYHPRMPTDLLLLLIIILVVVLVWRGPKTLPILGKAFGQGVKEARKEIDGMKQDAAERKDDGANKGDTAS